MADTPELSAINDQLASLREQGAHRYAPVRFRYLEAQTGRLAQLARVSLTPCLLYTSPSPRDATLSRMPSSA